MKLDANATARTVGPTGLRKFIDTAPQDAPPERPAPHANAAPLPFTMYDDCAKTKQKNWLVEGLLGDGEASSLFGEPGSGKSVLAQDIGMHIAADVVQWRGRKVQHGAVLLVALERARLVKRRAVAFQRRHGHTSLPFAIISEDLDFRELETADRIAKSALELERATDKPIKLIIVDTVSRALAGGDENSPKDMGQLIRTVARIQSLTGAHVLLTHHSPADGNARHRGHSSLKGALDTTIFVKKAADVRTATVEKANDSEEGVRITFALESVTIDVDEQGQETTAPVVVEVEERTAGRSAAPGPNLSDRQANALDALTEALLDYGIDAPTKLKLPASVKKVVSVEHWKNEVLNTVIKSGHSNPLTAFDQIKAALQRKKLVGCHSAFVWDARGAG